MTKILGDLLDYITVTLTVKYVGSYFTLRIHYIQLNAIPRCSMVNMSGVVLVN